VGKRIAVKAWRAGYSGVVFNGLHGGEVDGVGGGEGGWGLVFLGLSFFVFFFSHHFLEEAADGGEFAVGADEGAGGEDAEFGVGGDLFYGVGFAAAF
jgi:hypothetical protein